MHLICLGKRRGATITFGFILIRRCPRGQGLEVAAAMLLLLCGQQISLVVWLPLKRSYKSGLVILAQISLSFSLMELRIVLVEVRWLKIFLHLFLQTFQWFSLNRQRHAQLLKFISTSGLIKPTRSIL